MEKHPPLPEVNYDKKKLKALNEALSDAPDFKFLEGTTEDEWNQRLSEIAGTYGEDGAADIAETARNLTRLLLKEKEASGEGFVPTEGLVNDISDTVDVSYHSGGSFSCVEKLAREFGADVDNIYREVFPEKYGAMPVGPGFLKRLGKNALRILKK